MLDNNLYNLMEQMIEENKSLWRIKNTYKKDARACQDCVDFWNFLERDKEEHISRLRTLIQNHICTP